MLNCKVGDKVRAIESRGFLVKDKIYEVLQVINDEDDPKANLIAIQVDNGTIRTYLQSRFILEEVVNVSSLEHILSVTSKWGALGIQSELDDMEYRLNNIKSDITAYRNALKGKYTQERETIKRIKELEAKKDETFDYSSDIKALFEHDVIDKLEVIGNTMTIYTDYIDIYDQNGNKFKGNKYKLEFDYKKMQCNIFGCDEDYSRVSWWADRNGGEVLDPHPHVNGRTGEACWGSAGDMLHYSMNSFELYASFIIVYNFLQQVNTDDGAGAYIRNWDCIDEDGDDIDNPYTYDTECCVCQCGLLEDDDETGYCEICENSVCRDHSIWIDSESREVCSDCYENNYSTCEACGIVYNNEEIYSCSVCGEALCNDCVRYGSDGDSYCEKHYEEKFTICDGCGNEVEIIDTFYCEECGETFCNDCDEPKYNKNRKLCTSCYEEEIEEEDDEDEE